MTKWRGLAGLALAAALAACATAPPVPPPPTQQHPPRAPKPIVHGPPPAGRNDWRGLPGWDGEDHLAAMAAVLAACPVAAGAAMAKVCARAKAQPPATEVQARAFLESNFRYTPLAGDGLLTAYFSPQYEALEEPLGEFTAPVRPAPANIDTLAAKLDQQAAAGVPVALPDRTAIETSPADDVLAWMRPEDLFFLQIQGSGVLVFPDGVRLKTLFAASNGRPFVGLAKVMREQGLIDDAHTSGDAIHAWLAAHRGPEADAVMRQNPRYVFFRLEPDDGGQPVGAAGIPLPAGRALAVDPTRHGMGELYWIDAAAPALAGAFPVYRRLAAALDTGSAIRGDIRADLYIGRGDAEGREAGRVRHVLRMYRLDPQAEPSP